MNGWFGSRAFGIVQWCRCLLLCCCAHGRMQGRARWFEKPPVMAPLRPLYATQTKPSSSNWQPTVSIRNTHAHFASPRPVHVSHNNHCPTTQRQSAVLSHTESTLLPLVNLNSSTTGGKRTPGSGSGGGPALRRAASWLAHPTRHWSAVWIRPRALGTPWQYDFRQVALDREVCLGCGGRRWGTVGQSIRGDRSNVVKRVCAVGRRIISCQSHGVKQ